MKPNDSQPGGDTVPADADQVISVIVYVVVGLVGGFAFVVSYSHIYDLGQAHAQHGIAAKGMPLSVDMLIVAATLIMWRMTLKKAKPTGLAWAMPRLMLYSGIGATVAANVGYGLPSGWESAVISAWPGYVLAGLAETVMVTARWLREQSGSTDDRTVVTAGQPVIPSSSYEAAEAAYAASVTGGNPLSDYQLHKRFGIPRSQARKICAAAAPAGEMASVPGGTVERGRDGDAGRSVPAAQNVEESPGFRHVWVNGSGA